MSEARLEYIIDGFPKDYKNPKGIPRAEFIDDVGKFLEKVNKAAVEAKQFEGETLGKYRVMMENLEFIRRDNKSKIPEIERTIEAVEIIAKKEEGDINTHFALSDNVYASAKIKNLGKVILYLGAGCYVEHTCNEAIEVLKKSLTNAKKKDKELTIDIAWLQDQITTTEVNWSRLHNYAFYKRREKKN